jgi:hypothetical protein
MADHHEIDDLFKGRFEGVKDHQFDPTKQWVRFESQLDAALASSAAAASTGVSAWGMAASLAAVISVAGLVSQDRSHAAYEEPDAQRIHLTQSVDEWGSSEALVVASSGSFNSAASGLEASTVSSGLLAASTVTTAGSPPASNDASEVEVMPVQESLESYVANAYVNEEGATKHRRFAGVEKMPVLDLLSEINGVAERTMPTRIEAKMFRKHSAFVRLAMRTGNGESNSSSDPAQWRLNGLASIGYSYAFNAKTFITAEIGLLRRSGNGIERSKDVDLEPLANVLLNNFGGATEEEMELRRSFMNVRESFVAQRLDYLHMPVALHVNLTTHSNASIGTFVDYLVGVQNESYMVYNGMDYIRADFGLNDQSTMEGLNRWRLGLMAGYEQSISQHVTLDVRAMLPITTVFDRNSSYYQHAEPNQLVDIQLGLSYKI